MKKKIHYWKHVNIITILIVAAAAIDFVYINLKAYVSTIVNLLFLQKYSCYCASKP